MSRFQVRIDEGDGAGNRSHDDVVLVRAESRLVRALCGVDLGLGDAVGRIGADVRLEIGEDFVAIGDGEIISILVGKICAAPWYSVR